MAVLPVVPQYITVHLGRPDQAAENVTVPFTDYIKNVASNEIYPGWPEEAIKANILAQISYTLNKVYTEYYPSRGYSFDITNDTSIDHSYVKNGEVYDTISLLTDQLFNNYIRKIGRIEPYYAQFCDGKITQCNGLSQWGTVDLANQGLNYFEILQFYYGNDIEIVENAPVSDDIRSYPGVAFSLGSFGNDVLLLKRELNRISQNYPAIPKITELNGIFDREMDESVRAFQKIFNLAVDGVVGKATWYKIKQVFAAVKRLSELTGEGLSISEVERRYTEEMSLGSEGPDVESVQYYLAFLGYFYPQLPAIGITGFFNEETRDAVFTFQSVYGLPVTGIVDANTFYAIEREYKNAVSDLPANYRSAIGEPYPGRFLTVGDRGESVRIIQGYLNRIAENDPNIPTISVDGIFGEETKAAVTAFQKELGIEENGAIGPAEWAEIVLRANNI